MIHLITSASVLFAASAAAAAPVPAAALQDAASQGATSQGATSQGATSQGSAIPGDGQTQNASVFDAVRPLASSQLGALNGGQAVTGAFSNTALTELNSGNSITAGTVVSGGVSLGSNAFNGFDGLGNFVINTGNNNNLQGSLTVTVVMAPGLMR